MTDPALAAVSAAVRYIEEHPGQRPALAEVARAVHYSPWHLHRAFSWAMGLPLCRYIRRQLTRAALLLATTGRDILEIGQEAGYDSQRAFTAAFRAHYKQSPGAFRQEGNYWPLQLPVPPGEGPSGRGLLLAAAEPRDVPGWMELAARVVGDFPGFSPDSHREKLLEGIAEGRALVLRDGAVHGMPAGAAPLAGAAAFSREEGEVCFLAVHPQYRGMGVGRLLLEEAERRMGGKRGITITTFRAGDRGDNGQRAAYLGLGFTPGELLTQYGYPTQRLYRL